MKTKWNAALLAAMMVLGLILVGGETAYAQQTDAYNLGYRYGRQDKRENRSSDFRRYNNEFNRNTRRDFRQGYEDGYRDASNRNWGNIWRRSEPPNDTYGQGNGQNPPNWMIGSFRGYTPSNDTYTVITVGADGYITIAAENGEGYARGYYNRGTVSFEWGQYTFRREGNGFRAVNRNNSNDRVYYQRISR
ncbi:MAG TPA: hypothetical protein VK400_08705 [Pyrinomonadaceae bacterium]|nr:hypothetical protein [Pyrinomonadaceae bacterium]